MMWVCNEFECEFRTRNGIAWSSKFHQNEIPPETVDPPLSYSVRCIASSLALHVLQSVCLSSENISKDRLKWDTVYNRVEAAISSSPDSRV